MYTGWFLDVYDDPQDGVVIWFLDEDGTRRRLVQDFPVQFYAAGPSLQLRWLWRYLDSQEIPVRLERQERRDLFSDKPVPVLSCQVEKPSALPGLFRQAAQHFPTLTFYDADLHISLRYAALYNTFPLARCQIEVSGEDRLEAIKVDDLPWKLDPVPAPYSVLTLEPDCNPAHANPTYISIQVSQGGEPHEIDSVRYRLPLDAERPLLVNLKALLDRHNPDLLLTTYGDTWLLPYLRKLSRKLLIPLPLSRDARRGVIHRKERSYFSYGQVVHHGQQILLFGRWHIDRCNAMLFHDYGMQGVMELARVTAMPMQIVARTSPGTGISSMQILTALRQGVLVPWHKQQAERPKTVLQMLRSDQGGLVYQPTVGLHTHVAEIDFISMYPSIMEHFNVSPETVGSHASQESPNVRMIPQLGIPVDQERRGLVPATLKPLLEKRLAVKALLAELPTWDPRRKVYQAQASAHKWLLVTCFGYLGYKNARFGRIEAHEAVTAYGRDALLHAKEVAENYGGEVLHLYVDGMWVKKDGLSQPRDFQPILEEIVTDIGLPIALDGIYRWVAFLPSRVDDRVPVANRYFGVFQDGSLKMRGIEARRGDTAPFIARMQVEMLERLARVPEAEDMLAPLQAVLPDIYTLARRKLALLSGRKVPLEDLLVTQKLSRTLDEYHSPSPAARAAAQLEQVDKHLRPGQRVRFIFTLGEPGVAAWDLPRLPDLEAIDVPHYTELLLRAVATVIQPLGINEAGMRERVLSDSYQLPVSIGSSNRIVSWKPAGVLGGGRVGRKNAVVSSSLGF